MELLKKVRFQIEGACPILFDKPTGNDKLKTAADYLKDAENKLYRNSDGEICIPFMMLKACIREGSRDLGKKLEGAKNRMSIRSSLFSIEDLFPLKFKAKDKIGITVHDGIEVHNVKRQGSGGKFTMVQSYRPIIKQWISDGELIIYNGIPPEFINQALANGGLLYGIGGFRPEFGRFFINKFEEVK